MISNSNIGSVTGCTSKSHSLVRIELSAENMPKDLPLRGFGMGPRRTNGGRGEDDEEGADSCWACTWVCPGTFSPDRRWFPGDVCERYEVSMFMIEGARLRRPAGSMLDDRDRVMDSGRGDTCGSTILSSPLIMTTRWDKARTMELARDRAPDAEGDLDRLLAVGVKV
jgi:hypothetical protein